MSWPHRCHRSMDSASSSERPFQGGTVKEEYERCLTEDSEDPTEEWTEARERVAGEVIRHWTSLPEAVIPVAPAHRDWLLEDFKQHVDESVIPFEDAVVLEREARKPFLRLRSVDVLARWKRGQDGSRQLAQDVARKGPSLPGSQHGTRRARGAVSHSHSAHTP